MRFIGPTLQPQVKSQHQGNLGIVPFQDQSIDTFDDDFPAAGGDCGDHHSHHSHAAVVGNDEKELVEVAQVAVDHNGRCNNDAADADDDEDAIVDCDYDGACTTKDTTPGDATDDEAIDTQM